MKKLISLVISLVVAMSTITAFAQGGLTILKDGEKLNPDVAPFIAEDGYIMVPLRIIYESIGATVTWENDTRTAISLYNVNDEARALFLQIGTSYAFLNGEKFDFGKEAEIVGDRTFVPIGAVTQTLGYNVDWHPETLTVSITTK